MQHPFLFPSMLDAVVAGKLGMRHVVITGKGERVEQWLKRYRERPAGLSTVSRVSADAGDWLKQRNPLVESIDAGREGVMVCENGACKDGLDLGMGELEDAVPQL
jgi:hypothetical protein